MASQGGAAGGGRRSSAKGNRGRPCGNRGGSLLGGVKAFQLLLKVIGLQCVRDPKLREKRATLASCWVAGLERRGRKAQKKKL